MNKLWVIAQKDIREAFRSRSTYFYIVLLIVLTFSYISSYNSAINDIKSEGAGLDVITAASQVFLNTFSYTLPLWYAILICTIFATYSVVVDKAKRNIESLMATPVSLNQIWMGKTLAVTLPSVIIALAVFIIAYAVINIWFVIPNTDQFVFPSPIAIISAVILVPVLIFTVVSIVTYLQLTISNPRIANLVFTGIFFLLFFGGTILAGQGIAFDFAYIYLGLIIICAGISFLLSRSLTKEKVILSSKG